MTSMVTIKARDDNLQPPLTGQLFICTGMPFSFEDRKGNSITLFADQLAHGSWEKYKDGPVATRAMNTLYGRKSSFH